MNDAPQPESTPPRILTVDQFTAGMKRWFERKPALQHIGIKGVITGMSEFAGNLGFTMKGERSVIECVAWSGDRRAFPPLRDDVEVIALGSVGIYPKRGGYRLYVESVELTGQHDRLYERLRAKFAAEGLFDPERKRSVPRLIHRIALVSTPDGLGASDFLKTIVREVPFVSVVVVPTRVEGEGAEIEIADALDKASRLDVEAIVLARGGGKQEQLFAFNLEPVVRAIVRASKPVLTAIAHTDNHYLADDVADIAFGTPSLAAEFIAKAWQAARERLRGLDRDLNRAARLIALAGAQHLQRSTGALEPSIRRALESKRAALYDRTSRLERNSPQRKLADVRQRITADGGRLDMAAARILSAKTRARTVSLQSLVQSVTKLYTGVERHLERSTTRLDGLNPLAPLGRGYAIISKDGRTVRDVAVLRPGDRFQAEIERGRIEACVESVEAS
jgi:exodeoxyribonuclease VII large subunit